MYLALLSVLLIAWIVRITAFAPRQDWLTTAGIARIPGIVIVAAVGVFYVVLLGITFWPRERHAKGEFREGDSDDWKDTDR